MNCDAYTNAAKCGKNDDQDFDSVKMCCNCGGGAFGRYLSSIPNWLTCCKYPKINWSHD